MGIIDGHGDIANILRMRKGALYFAAGVSNSGCKDELEFIREKFRLRNAIRNANDLHLCLFYFGSISCFYNSNRYTKHKEEMEHIIKIECFDYNIIRIGNIDWGTNPNTFINFIRTKQAKGEQVEIRDEWKYMVSKEQLRLLCDNLPLAGKNEISIFGEMKKVIDCI
jgi:hypothetical protein